MFSTVTSGALCGLDSYLVQVEVDASSGMPCFQMVGFLSNEVREAKDRVKVALKNAGIHLPPMSIHVNLSPADVRKEGTAYDLPIVVGILASVGHISGEGIQDLMVLGELGLNGEVKAVKGVLPMVREARKQGLKQVMLPKANVKEACLVEGIKVIGVSHFKEAYQYLACEGELREEFYEALDAEPVQNNWIDHRDVKDDFKDVNGQIAVKKAAEIAAAGFHNLLMIGPPGAGKSMIAKRIPGILPPLSKEEALELAEIYSIMGCLDEERPLSSVRPFMAPHHTVSAQALVGGGRIPKPGVISMAHKGVLFLDELAEFNRTTIDMLRQPIEEKKVQISRNYGTMIYPAEFMLVAATNPCPCGYYPDRNKCQCTELEIRRYLQHISGPMLDRMDMCVDTPAVELKDLLDGEKNETSEAIRKRVMVARSRQRERYQGTGIGFNSELTGKQVQQYCSLKEPEKRYMEEAFERLQLSARSYHRLLRLARTIADVEDSDTIEKRHLMQAICFRSTIDKYWRK